MAVSANQLIRLLDRLIDRTSAGTVSWERSLSGANYQARVDEYIITIENGGPAIFQGVQFVVKKLNGSTLATSSNGIVVNAANNIPASGQILEKIIRLYELIDNTSDEFENLIKLI